MKPEKEYLLREAVLYAVREWLDCWTDKPQPLVELEQYLSGWVEGAAWANERLYEYTGPLENGTHYVYGFRVEVRDPSVTVIWDRWRYELEDYRHALFD